MNHRLSFVIIALLVLNLFADTAYAQSGPDYMASINKKQEEKKSVRWTLADWLAQKQRTRMMDLWLVRNSTESPFEFFLGGHSLNYDVTTAGSATPVNEDLYGGAVGAYAGVVGLRGSYEKYSEDRGGWDGSLNLRVFGRQLQDSHINVQYGLQGLEFSTTKEKFQNQFAGVGTNIYLTKYFGLSGSYQFILSGESDRNSKMEGERSTAGVFIDFSALRLFGEWRKENLSFATSTGASSRESREGFGGGLQLYF